MLSLTGMHDLRFLLFYLILLDRAVKAGKTGLNGGTPTPAPPLSAEVPEAHLALIPERPCHPGLSGSDLFERCTDVVRAWTNYLTHGASGDPQNPLRRGLSHVLGACEPAHGRRRRPRRPPLAGNLRVREVSYAQIVSSITVEIGRWALTKRARRSYGADEGAGTG